MAGRWAGWAAVVVMLAAAGRAADCREPVVRTGGLAIVPFAIPVAVPVASVVRPQIFYAWQAYPPEAVQVPRPGAAREVPAERTEALAPAGAGLAQCIRCHGPVEPKGGLDLSRLDRLDAAARLGAIGRLVTADPALRMPKGEPPLSAEDVAALVERLSR